MPVYFIAQVNVHDPEGYEKYRSGFMPILQQYGGEVTAIDREVKIIEGEWPHQGTVILKFPDEDQAMKWYNSPEYQGIVQDRHRSTHANLILMKGM
ncbi:MAG: DUF1330 domain-containing protein [Deltaproteobacteria bacterium]|nr:DUF1330 domain-containing protein [Deltaproteobacteria bacterium]MCK5711021.1 DUF1330 domain-containing protein [Deltaproteobacteria bacterium]